jgi:hypothetical protein
MKARPGTAGQHASAPSGRWRRRSRCARPYPAVDSRAAPVPHNGRPPSGSSQEPSSVDYGSRWQLPSPLVLQEALIDVFRSKHGSGDRAPPRPRSMAFLCERWSSGVGRLTVAAGPEAVAERPSALEVTFLACVAGAPVACRSAPGLRQDQAPRGRPSSPGRSRSARFRGPCGSARR